MNVFANAHVAAEYDDYYLSGHGRRMDAVEKRAMDEVIRPVEPGYLLEVGSGTGHWTQYFLERGFAVTASEVSEPMLARLRSKGLPVEEIVRASVLDLPFADDSFDQVAVVTALEFCGDIPRALAEIRRVLRPGGWVVAGCLNADSELGKGRADNPVYSHGEFMTRRKVESLFATVGTTSIRECAFLSPSFELLDGTATAKDVQGAFFAVAARKEK